MTEGARSAASRFVPRLALVGEADAADDLLEEFPGRFTLSVCATAAELDSALVTASVDLVVVDCRRTLPASETLAVLRRETMIDFLAVGMPPDRRTLPSWMRSHGCPWPLDRTSFYRLVMASARKADFERLLRRAESDNARLETEARLGRALATALHEINNPLDASLRYARLARKVTAEAATRQNLDAVLLGLDRIAEQVHSVQRDARKAATELRMIDVRDAIREASVLGGIDGGAALRTTVGEGLPGVPREIVRVLVNLLANARRAGGDRVRIDIDARVTDSRLEISVRDDGEGFGDLFAEELFEPYYTTHAASGGIGLGLHSARVAVEQLGGTLTAASAGVGRGATFTIRIPCPAVSNDAEESS